MLRVLLRHDIQLPENNSEMRRHSPIVLIEVLRSLAADIRTSCEWTTHVQTRL